MEWNANAGVCVTCCTAAPGRRTLRVSVTRRTGPAGFVHGALCTLARLTHGGMKAMTVAFVFGDSKLHCTAKSHLQLPWPSVTRQLKTLIYQIRN